MDNEVSRICRTVSNAIFAGTEHNSCFNYRLAFAVNVAASFAERTRLLNNLKSEIVPTITGSSAEFYMEPMLSCIGDYDIMYCFCHELAIPAGYPLSLLPTSVGTSKLLDVYEIHDSGSGISSYVYLVKSAAETTSIHSVDEYTLCIARMATIKYLSNRVHEYSEQASGPALVHDMAELLNNHGLYFTSSVSSDLVRCMYCPVWPPQAAEWPHRPRYRGWPDSLTVDRVVRQGCDVVPVSHPCHRSDTSQWRLSFSRAEVILLNCWTPLQQIVYNMLRFFVKTERLTGKIKEDSVGDRLSMYHVKTLMLWACELKHRHLWASDNIIQLCRELLNRLGAFLTEAHCAHYFIQNCNLLHYVNTADRQIEDAVRILISVTNLELANWFIHSYLKRYAAYNCPSYIQQLLHQIETSAQLENALSAVVEWRSESFLGRSFGKLSSAVSDIGNFLDSKITTRTCKIYNAERATIGPLHGVFVAFVFLKCAGEVKTVRCLSDEVLHVLATAADHDFGVISDLFENEKCDSETLDKLVAYWYRHVSAEFFNISWRMYTELTKAHLHLALRYRDRDADNSVHCLAAVFLASLYCTTGHYQTAFDLCRDIITRIDTQSIAANDHRKVLKVDAQLLSKCFSDVETVVGFVSLYNYLTRTAMPESQRTKYYTNSCSVEALARFISVKCHLMDEVTAARNASLYEAVRHYRRCVVESLDNLSLADVLLFQLVKAVCAKFDSQSVFRWSGNLGRTRRLNGYDPNELCEMLIHLAVERLTVFRQFQMDQFGNECVVTTTDFEALNAYRCQQYDRCLASSRDIANSTLFMKTMPVIFVYGPQLVLMDDDIASIVGVMNLVRQRQSSWARTATQISIALYLEIQCLLRLQCPLRHLRDALFRTQIAYHRLDVRDMSLSHWILAFIYRKARLHLTTFGERILCKSDYRVPGRNCSASSSK